MHVWNLLHVIHWKYRTQKWRQKSQSGHHPTTLSGYISATKARIDNQKKKLLSSNISSRGPHNMVNFGTLVAEIVSLVPLQISTGFASWQRYCTALQYWASAKLRHWTEGATYNRQGGHHVGHWPTFLVFLVFPVLGVSQTLRHWTEGATYIWQGGHHVGHWPTFLVYVIITEILELEKVTKPEMTLKNIQGHWTIQNITWHTICELQ